MTTTQISEHAMTIAKRIVGDMIRSERFANYQSEERSDFINNSDRASRCYDAAENGADGSTHAECIQDMRDFWEQTLQWGRNDNPVTGMFREYPTRLDAAMCAYFDSLEEWHEKNGSLWQEIG